MDARLLIPALGLSLLLLNGAEAQSLSSQQPSRLYSQLELAVDQEDWSQAIEIVDRLLELQPQREEELRSYRNRLQALSESVPPQVEILSARGEVFSTRTERRQKRPDSTFIRDARDIAIIVVPGLGPVLATEYPISVQLPDQYAVDVSFRGAVNKTEEIEATVTLTGGGEQRLTRRIPVGGAVAVTTETFVFSSRQVPAPSRVTIGIADGATQTFSLNLPNRTTVLAEARTVRER